MAKIHSIFQGVRLLQGVFQVHAVQHQLGPQGPPEIFFSPDIFEDTGSSLVSADEFNLTCLIFHVLLNYSAH